MVLEMQQSPHQSDVASIVDASVSEHDLARGPGLAFNEYECEVSTGRSSLGGGLVLSKLSVKRIQVILLRDIFRFGCQGNFYIIPG